MSSFVIRRVLSGPEELSAVLPLSGRTVAVWTEPDGDGPFIRADLERPVKHRADHDEQDEHDEHGPFRWITDVVLRPHHRGEQPYAGMRDFLVDVAYVTVSGAGSPEESTTLDYVAVVAIDDADDDEPVPDIAEPEQFQRMVEEATAALERLSGEELPEHRRPRRVGADESDTTGTSIYQFRDATVRCRIYDPEAGWVWHESTDADEVLYWIVEDLASSLAWHWAQRAPTYGSMTDQQAQKTLWMPYWHILMHGLRPDWGKRTRNTIRDFTRRNAVLVTPPPLRR